MYFRGIHSLQMIKDITMMYIQLDKKNATTQMHQEKQNKHSADRGLQLYSIKSRAVKLFENITRIRL